MLDLEHKMIFEGFDILFDFRTYKICRGDMPSDVWERIQNEEEYKFFDRGITLSYNCDKGTSIDDTDGISDFNKWINEYNLKYGKNT